MWRDIRPHPEEVLAKHARDYRAWVRPLLARKEFVGVLAVDPSGTPVASGCVWFQVGQPRPGSSDRRRPYILSMYTHPDHRGRSLATRIVRKLIAICRAGKFGRVELHAAVMGRNVYRRLGFERTWEMRRWIDPKLARAHAQPPRRRPPRRPRPRREN